MKVKYLLILFICSKSFLSFGQNQIISGYIIDCKTNEKLIGAHIKEIKSTKGTVTNNFGFFSLSVPTKDSIDILISHIGYKNEMVRVKPIKGSNLHISICEGEQAIDQVEVIASRFSSIHQNNVLNIPVKEIKSLPAIFGETDVLRAYMLMPGVQGGKEGTSELYVRGGTPDQNLIILDDIPLYYINHIGGFVSIFDNNAIKNVDLIKGGFPAQYGGRLSAVTDIRMRDGNMHTIEGEFTLGLVSSKLLLEGPVIKEKSSFLVTARRSLFDIFTRPLSFLESGGKISAGYTFYDVNAKYQHKLSNRDRLFVSFYSGHDRIFLNYNEKDAEKKYKSIDRIKWGNILGALRWNHQFNQKLFLNLTSAYTNFAYKTDFEYISEYQTGQTDSKYINSYLSDISDWIIKLDLDVFAGENHNIKIGANSTFHTYKPGVASFKKIYGQSQNIDTTFGSSSLQATEVQFYAEDEIKISKRISTNFGIHYSLFSIEGKLFQSVQPRIIAGWYLTPKFSLKASYSEMSQNIHLLTNSSSSQPTDLWVPATAKLKPEHSVQYSFGINSLLIKSTFELGVDAYYKEMDNLIEYKEGASFFSSSKDWQEKVEIEGKGRVYGLEFLLRKRTGKTKGWIAYTLSKNERYFKNLNFGEAYPFKYDRRHDFALVITHQLKKNIILSTSWTYNSGYHLTLAEGKYNLVDEGYHPTMEIPKNSIYPLFFTYNNTYIYNGKNNYQTNDYHRLDVSCSFIKKKRKGTRTLTVGIYNAYNRLNPYYLYYKYEEKQLNLYQFSLFSFIPSISYSYKFGKN